MKRCFLGAMHTHESVSHVGSCLYVVYLSSMVYKSFDSFGMSTIVKVQEEVYYLLLLLIFSNDKTLYNPLSKYRNLVKVSYKKLCNQVSDKYLIHVSCNNALFQSKLSFKKAVIRNFNCEKKYQCRSVFFNRYSLKLHAIYKKGDCGTGVSCEY